MIAATCQKWTQTIAISWSNHLAYKLNFFLQVIGPTLIFFFIKVSLWDAIYGISPEMEIQGYDLQGMISYQGWVMVVTLLAQGHTSMKLSEDIRLGRISAYLIYPFTLWQFQFCSFIAFQGIQLLVASVSLVTLVLISFIELPGMGTILIGLAYCTLVGVFWFSVQYIIGLFSFWLEETWVLRVLVSIAASFLSGAILPLELFPAQFVSILEYTPFPYITHVPVKMMTGGATESVGLSFLVMSFWALVLSGVAHLTWRRGVRLYSAAGM